MHIARRALTFVQGFLTSYGPSSIKKLVWDGISRVTNGTS